MDKKLTKKMCTLSKKQLSEAMQAVVASFPSGIGGEENQFEKREREKLSPTGK